MNLSNWYCRLDKLTEEKARLLGELDGFVDDVCKVIMEIADILECSYCPNCKITARRLFRLIKDHGDENAVADILEQFFHKTGISLNG